jgi:hypothetical protein
MAAKKSTEVDAVGREMERVRVAEAELRARNMAQGERLASVKVVPVQEAPATRWPFCEYFDCRTRLDSFLSPTLSDAERTAARAGIFARAEAHGLHVGSNRHGVPSLYCSKSCHMRDTDLNKGRVIVKEVPKVPLPAPKVADTTGFQRCERMHCDAQVTTSRDPDRATSILAAYGWKHAPHGVFCSDECVRDAGADIASGTGTKKTIGAKKTAAA